MVQYDFSPGAASCAHEDLWIPERTMATRPDNPAPFGPIDRLEAALGGAPLPRPITDDHGDKKARKREVKLRRDAERPPGSFERWRILLELVNEGRQVVDLADHKARYALVIMGVLNAGVFFLMSRAHLFGDMPPTVKPWMIGFLVVYAALTFLFVYYAVDCLRPRQLHYADKLGAAAGRPDEPVPRGLLYWEAIAAYDLESYQRAWSEARMEQLNAEVVVIAHHLARLIRAKYLALGRLYIGLAALVVLAGVLLAVFTLFGVLA
jgi:hypothetical protein